MRLPGPSPYNDRDQAILQEIGVVTLELTLNAAGMIDFIESLKNYVQTKGIHIPMLYAAHMTIKKQERRCSQVLARIDTTSDKANHEDIKEYLTAMTEQTNDALKIFSDARKVTQEAISDIAKLYE